MADPLIVAGRGIRVAFFEVGNRWRHEIACVGADGRTAVAIHSVECDRPGKPAADRRDAGSPSPPLQHVDLTDLAGGRVAALAVGKTAEAHWSLSCAVEDLEAGLIAFDIACRCGDNPGHSPRSTYRIADGTSVVARDDHLELISPVGRLVLRPLHNASVQHEGPHVVLTPSGSPSGSAPATIRWHYAVGAASREPEPLR